MNTVETCIVNMWTVLARILSSLMLSTARSVIDFPVHLGRAYTGNEQDICKEIGGLVTEKGYPFERHHVNTEDGYIIEMHRIPHGRRPCPDPCHRTPIFLLTGLLADSTSFVMDYPEQSLGFVLPDNGYDLWLGNGRGNTFGRLHKRISSDSKDFWNFTFHEHALYDIPAQIDYILDKTKSKSLLYIGLSQGTLEFFTLLSERPSYNEKIRAFAGLAPFHKLAHIRVGGLTIIKPYMRRFLENVDNVGMLEFGHRRYSTLKVVRAVCALPVRRVCALAGDAFINMGSKYMNMLIASKRAQKFDYGPEVNSEVYGQVDPPEYTLGNVRTDVGLFWSKGDQFVPPEDVEELAAALGERVKKTHYIDDPFYTHMHFAVSNNNPTVLYKDLQEFLGRYIK
ncbi:gastric triacylglycerol lipase-like isoform X2 [Ornithodoros turicata]|uniref:gastric triacylglycerol lipase-like isoform X2 n=1 Tax=Ornithodoros turicata TaxID=34597 RepID=UPI0031394B8A